jgi:hypothetical protein
MIEHIVARRNKSLHYKGDPAGRPFIMLGSLSIDEILKSINPSTVSSSTYNYGYSILPGGG